jgi:hypothetical protein
MSDASPSIDPLWWSKIPCSTPGIGRVDEVHDALVENLERLKAARTARERNLVVPPWADEKQQLAFDLACAAIAAHEEVAEELPQIRARLRALDGRAFARRFEDVTDQLHGMLNWIPFERMRHLNPTGRGPAFLADLERPYIAYLAVTRPTGTATGRGAFERVQSFVRLSVEALELEREHIRRQPETVRVESGRAIFPDSTIPALALTNSRWDELRDPAWDVLQAMLPNRAVRAGAYGGSPEDRDNDFPQALRLRLLELVEKVRTKAPLDQLAEAYDGEFRFLAASAEADFRNDRAKERRQKRILPTELAGDTIETYAHGEAGVDAGQQTRVTLPEDRNEAANRQGQRRRIARSDRVTSTPPSPPDAGAELYRSSIQRLFKHTPTELRLLDALLRSDSDPNVKGGVSLLAELAGCDRATASHYIAKLRMHLARSDSP